MRELEHRFCAYGCAIINLTVTRANAQVQGFYERLGFNPRDVILCRNASREAFPKGDSYVRYRRTQ